MLLCVAVLALIGVGPLEAPSRPVRASSLAREDPIAPQLASALSEVTITSDGALVVEDSVVRKPAARRWSVGGDSVLSRSFALSPLYVPPFLASMRDDDVGRASFQMLAASVSDRPVEPNIPNGTTVLFPPSDMPSYLPSEYRIRYRVPEGVQRRRGVSSLLWTADLGHVGSDRVEAVFRFPENVKPWTVSVSVGSGGEAGTLGVDSISHAWLLDGRLKVWSTGAIRALDIFAVQLLWEPPEEQRG